MSENQKDQTILVTDLGHLSVRDNSSRKWRTLTLSPIERNKAKAFRSRELAPFGLVNNRVDNALVLDPMVLHTRNDLKAD